MFCALAALLCASVLAVPAAAAEVESGSVYCFASTDFSGEENLAGICITAVPDSGAVMLGQHRLQPGDVLTSGQIAGMTYHPGLTEQDRQAEVSYLPVYPDGVQARNVMSIAVIGKADQAPVAEDSALETYRNLPNEAQLRVKEPEGQAMT